MLIEKRDFVEFKEIQHDAWFLRQYKVRHVFEAVLIIYNRFLLQE